VIATIDPDNLPSIRIAGKLGMRFVERRTDEFGLPELLYSIRSGEHRAGAHAG
jgi:RimJ/RimL family protein N-acetyltransferase